MKYSFNFATLNKKYKNMKVDIEIYRGWQISFDTDKENFYCHSEQYDRDENKKSFASVKKFIDDFLKDNEKFVPFWVEGKPKSYKYGKIKIVGIRKDGKFIYEDEKGEKNQLSGYDEKDYILYDEANEEFKIEAEKLQEQSDLLLTERRLVLGKIKGIELVDYRKELQHGTN